MRQTEASAHVWQPYRYSPRRYPNGKGMREAWACRIALRFALGLYSPPVAAPFAATADGHIEPQIIVVDAESPSRTCLDHKQPVRLVNHNTPELWMRGVDQPIVFARARIEGSRSKRYCSSSHELIADAGELRLQRPRRPTCISWIAARTSTASSLQPKSCWLRLPAMRR